MNAACLQYSYLLTSQLESQRIYWENKIVHLEKETAEEVMGLYVLYIMNKMNLFLTGQNYRNKLKSV